MRAADSQAAVREDGLASYPDPEGGRLTAELRYSPGLAATKQGEDLISGGVDKPSSHPTTDPDWDPAHAELR